MQAIATAEGLRLPLVAVARHTDLSGEPVILAGQRHQGGFLAAAQESFPSPTKQGLAGRSGGADGLRRGVAGLLDATSHGIERSLRGIGRRGHCELLGRGLCNAAIALHRACIIGVYPYYSN